MWSFRAEGTPTQIQDQTEDAREQAGNLGLAKPAETVRQAVLDTIDELASKQQSDDRVGVAAEITHRRGHEDEMEYRVEICFKAVPVAPDLTPAEDVPTVKMEKPKPALSNGKKLDSPTKPAKSR